MKKAICLLMVFCIVCGLMGCKHKADSKDDAPKKNEALTDSKIESVVEDTPQYKDIVCRKSSDIKWQTIRFKEDFSGAGIDISIPSDWTIKKKDFASYNILRANKEIGRITTSHIPASKETFEYSTNKNKEKYMERFRQVNLYEKDGKDYFRRIFSFENTENNTGYDLFIMVDYEQLDDTAADKLYNSAASASPYVNTTFTPISKTNGSKRFLILGNSFIGTSQVGSFLNDMLMSSGSGYSVKAVSIGYANVTTFINDVNICNSIENGEYSYVFLCGFYSMQSANAVADMERICKKSNTQLVLFPAHNEGEASVKAAKDKFSHLTCVDWQGEINSLIDSGIHRSNFCIDDAHQHSTTLAGYVGAHMIYRGLFGKTPPKITEASPLSMTSVRATLGSYVDKKSLERNGANFKGKVYDIE